MGAGSLSGFTARERRLSPVQFAEGNVPLNTFLLIHVRQLVWEYWSVENKKGTKRIAGKQRLIPSNVNLKLNLKA